LTTLVLRPGLQLPRATVSGGGGIWGEVYSPSSRADALKKPSCGGRRLRRHQICTADRLRAGPRPCGDGRRVPSPNSLRLRRTGDDDEEGRQFDFLEHGKVAQPRIQQVGARTPSTTAAIPAVSTSCISTTSGKIYFSPFFHFPQVRKVTIPESTTYL
jgi:hypothetical protein